MVPYAPRWPGHPDHTDGGLNECIAREDELALICARECAVRASITQVDVTETPCGRTIIMFRSAQAISAHGMSIPLTALEDSKPQSSAAIAAISACESSKSNTAFFAMRSGLIDLGIVTYLREERASVTIVAKFPHLCTGALQF